MKRIPYLTLLACLSCIVVTSCAKFGASIPDPNGYEVSIYPGDCLGSKLKTYNEVSIDHTFEGVDALLFHVDLPYNNTVKEVVERFASGKTIYYRYAPTDKAYTSFGGDAKKVKDSYDELYSSYCNDNGHSAGRGVASTVYYREGMIITADKSFAGIPAGENLASIVHFYPNSDYLYKRIPSVDVPNGFFTLREGIWFTFIIEGYEVVTEDVNFHIEIPVKVGMLLNLLHDRLTDPEAQMQYRDEVLVGDFVLPRGLH